MAQATSWNTAVELLLTEFLRTSLSENWIKIHNISLKNELEVMASEMPTILFRPQSVKIQTWL